MISRRAFLASASALALAGPAAARASYRAGVRPIRVRPVPLECVRLAPSIYARAVETNRRTLLALEPDRLLHNFHLSAGLPPKGALYGGWEARGIAGHTLGHYLSACALMVAQTGDAKVSARLAYTVAELARIQAAHGDFYIGGTVVERGGRDVDGKIVFEEIRRGEIRTGPFDVNGGWVPLYAWHKVHAGLIDAHRFAHVPEALPVMLGMAGYLATILESLDDARMQVLLAAEYGGLNESYAETYAMTGERRWLRIAERIRDRKILDPLAEGRDILPGLHANTQIPKLIGLARLYELTGDPRHAAAARFFHGVVVGHHSYVIGGNSEREHFGPPDVIAPAITERTCEACNSYNMLKLTRHLYGWRPHAALFDYYERTHLNHIMAHQHPESGRFVYFMPLGSGARRTYSTAEDSFWCCVGSGMESHSKHGDSIYWHDDATLYVNLFIPSSLDWKERGLRLSLSTGYPFAEDVTLTLDAVGARPFAMALRLPGWCEAPAVTLNGKPAPFLRRDGYAVLARRWRKGDRIGLHLPMKLAIEPTPDDPRRIAFVHGPVVLAADMGPASADYDGPAPALIAGEAAGALRPIDPAAHLFRMPEAVPEARILKPFFNQYDRRTAVYFPLLTPGRWAAEQANHETERRARAAIDARTVDVIRLGEPQAERDHGFAANHSDLFSYAGRSARQAPWGVGNYFEFSLAVRPGTTALRALYWGEETDKDFDILIDGALVAKERRKTPPEKRFVGVEYPIPPASIAGRDRIRVRFVTRGTDAMVYEARTLTSRASDA
jgi:DUF1680 family protein